ncbi:MAG: hypothetical protein RLZZ229_853 [Actinomycetota bacterium]
MLFRKECGFKSRLRHQNEKFPLRLLRGNFSLNYLPTVARCSFVYCVTNAVNA